MHTVFRQIYPIPTVPNPNRHWRILVLYAGITGYLITRLPLIVALGTAADTLNWSIAALALTLSALSFGSVIAYVLVRRYQLVNATIVFTAVLLAEAAIFLLAGSWTELHGWLALWAGVAIAHLLLARRDRTLVLLGVLALIALSGSPAIADMRASNQYERIASIIAAAMGTITLAVSGSIVAQGSDRAIHTAIQDLSSRHLIEMGQNIANHVSARDELATALQNIANDIEARFSAVDHVQVYLIETFRDHATLIAATGAVGQQLLQQEYSLSIGGLSPVGRTTLTSSLVTVTDYRYEVIYTPHELLIDMQSELAIPLKTNDRVIGALDVQSRQPEAFHDANITLFSAIANQITIAVDALQLYSATQRSIRENRALYEQTQMNLREIERLNYQLTGRAWSEYLRLKNDVTALTLDFQQDQTATEAEWTSTLDETAKLQQVITVKQDGQRIVAFPIIVRNEVVGAMEFELPTDDDLPEGATDLVMAVSQRLGLALENRRLFDETQRIAQREGMINDIGAELQAATSVDAIIQRTARQLQDTLSAQEITIRISRNAHGQ